MIELLGRFLVAVNVIALVYFALLNAVYLAASLCAYRRMRQHAKHVKILDVEDIILSAGVPPITIIIPAYNEQNTCCEAIKSQMTLDYPRYEILVVNDGSRDATLERLIEAFELRPTDRVPMSDLTTAPIRAIYCSELYPDLWVIDKANGGKADALNVGLRFCRTPLFCAIDADSLLERDALKKVVRPFLEDAATVAAGGSIRIANGCTVREGQLAEVGLPRSLLARFQVLEYLRAFLAGRIGWEVFGATVLVSGAFGLFRRSTVIAAGGFARGTVGEDMELTIRLHRHCIEQGQDYRITFIPDPVVWTECPESLAVLGKQRDRWQRGLIDSMTWHIALLFNPRYGFLGMFAMPTFFFLEMLGPLIELLGYASLILAAAMGFLNGPYVLAFLMMAIVLGSALSIAAVGLEEPSLRRYPGWRNFFHLFLLALLDNFGYRQLNTLWRVRGTVSAILGRKGWGKMPRKGFATAGGER